LNAFLASVLVLSEVLAPDLSRMGFALYGFLRLGEELLPSADDEPQFEEFR
jgi:hypothetical protein